VAQPTLPEPGEGFLYNDEGPVLATGMIEYTARETARGPREPRAEDDPVGRAQGAAPRLRRAGRREDRGERNPEGIGRGCRPYNRQMPLHATRSPPLPSGSAPEPTHCRVPFWRSFGFASIALSAACAGSSSREVRPAPATVTVVVAAAAPVAVATPALAPAHARSCRSNDECGAIHPGDLCLAPAGTKELADAEDFLGRAMSLYYLITRLGEESGASPLTALQKRARDDVAKYGRIAQGRGGADGNGVGQGVSLTNAQKQDAAWMQSGATQADWSIQQFAQALSGPIKTDAPKIYADIAGDSEGLHFDRLIGDLQTFLRDIEAAVAPVNTLITLREPDGSPLTPKSGAGALLVYIGPLIEEIHDATSRVTALLDPSAISLLGADLTLLSQGHDLVGKNGNSGTCLSL
jgi:hypothetical protein